MTTDGYIVSTNGQSYYYLENVSNLQPCTDEWLSTVSVQRSRELVGISNEQYWPDNNFYCHVVLQFINSLDPLDTVILLDSGSDISALTEFQEPDYSQWQQNGSQL